MSSKCIIMLQKHLNIKQVQVLEGTGISNHFCHHLLHQLKSYKCSMPSENGGYVVPKIIQSNFHEDYFIINENELNFF